MQPRESHRGPHVNLDSEGMDALITHPALLEAYTLDDIRKFFEKCGFERANEDTEVKMLQQNISGPFEFCYFVTRDDQVRIITIEKNRSVSHFKGKYHMALLPSRAEDWTDDNLKDAAFWERIGIIHVAPRFQKLWDNAKRIQESRAVETPRYNLAKHILDLLIRRR